MTQAKSTDLENFKNTYAQCGIELKINTIDPDEDAPPLASQYIFLREGIGEEGGVETNSETFSGYSGFGSRIYFDANGKYISQSFIE